MKKALALLLAAAVLLSLAGCGGKAEPAAAPVDLNALYESYGEQLPDMFFPDEATLLNFLGIELADCAQSVVAVCADGMRTDEVWLIEAKDEEALQRLTALAQTRLQAKADETVSYAPDQYAVVEKAELLTSGLYLALLVSPEVETLKAGFEAAVG